MELGKQIKEALSWRLITELWRRYPDSFNLVEIHPGGGQYDCLSFVEKGSSFSTVLEINRCGSLHLHKGRSPASWPDWLERMCADPRQIIDEVSHALGYEIPETLPKSSPETIAFRFICEFLTHSIGRLEFWECRNGFHDTSGYGGGKQTTWFERFPAIKGEDLARKLAVDGLDPTYNYWFLLKNIKPLICVDTGGNFYTQDGKSISLTKSYSRHKRIWPVITETALKYMP